VVADLDGAGCEDALGAVQRGKSLRKLRHVPTNGWQSIHQDNVIPGVGDVKGGLHARDAGADDECPWNR